MSKFTTRSRGGCANCKAWKVKCDEGKPDCARCLKRGKLCFYDLNIHSYERPAPPPGPQTLSSGTVTLQRLFAMTFANKNNAKDFGKVLKMEGRI